MNHLTKMMCNHWDMVPQLDHSLWNKNLQDLILHVQVIFSPRMLKSQLEPKFKLYAHLIAPMKNMNVSELTSTLLCHPSAKLLFTLDL